jgi:3'(2'), 5'-bisphosphate nucleotidase
MDMDQNSPEVMTAIQAAIKASVLCEKIRMGLAGGESLLKRDRSPVTIADYGAQAIICNLIRERFPNDTIVAEEDSRELRRPDRSTPSSQFPLQRRCAPGLILVQIPSPTASGL